MCLEDRLLGQKAAAAPTAASEEDDGGEEAEEAEKGGGTSPGAAASAASDWFGGPYMPPWLTSLEKLLYGNEEEASGKMHENCIKRLQLLIVLLINYFTYLNTSP